MTNEEAIKWLTLQKNKGILWDDYSDETKGIRENAELRIMIAYEMAIEALAQEPNTWSLDDAREDFMHDVYNTLDFLETNDEANRIIDSFDRVTSSIRREYCTVTEFADRCRECGARYGKLLKELAESEGEK